MLKDYKYQQMKKAYETTIELKDQVIRDLRTELFEKEDKIQHLKFKVDNIKRDLQKIITETAMNRANMPLYQNGVPFFMAGDDGNGLGRNGT